jgi:hypothetical protein
MQPVGLHDRVPLDYAPPETIHVYGFPRRLFDARTLLKTKSLVGAGRFERPTRCAQGIGTFNAGSFISFIYSMGWPYIVYSQHRAM